MNVYFNIFREDKKSKISKSNFGAFLLIGGMGPIRSLHLDFEKSLTTHTYSHGVTKDSKDSYIYLIIESHEYDNFLSLVLDERLRNIFYRVNFIGHSVSLGILSMMGMGINKYSAFRLFDENIIFDIKLREMILEVAEGVSISQDHDYEYSIRSLSQKYGSKLRCSLPDHFTSEIDADKIIPMRDHILTCLRTIREIYLKQVNRDNIIKSNLGNFSLECESNRVKYDFALHIMSSRGVVVDKKSLKKIKMSLNSGVIDADKKMVDEHFAVEKMNKSEFSILIDEKSIEARLVADGVARRSSNGKILKKSFDLLRSSSDALKSFSEQTNNRIVLRQVIPSILKSMGKKNTLYPNFVSFSTTGRAYSYEPNIMGIPTKGGVRESFQARSGYTFIIADYDSVEMRVFAQVLLDTVGKSKLAEQYQANTSFDPHSLLASCYLNISYEEGLRLKSMNDSNFIKARKQMKALNFGFMGGASYETIALSLQESFGGEIKTEESIKLGNLYFEVFPEVKEYFSFVRSELGESYISNAFIDRSKMLIGKRNFNQMLNNYVQSLASDGSLTALYNITRKGFSKMSPLFETRPLISIHDELVIEVKKDLALETSKAIKIEMESSMNRYTPNVPSSVETRQSDNWTKLGVLI